VTSEEAWFHWTGEVFLMGAPPNAPKIKALTDRPGVALAIRLVHESVETTFPEYAEMARRYLGDEGGQRFQALARETFTRWTRIAIQPEEVRILDFKHRFPSAWGAAPREARPTNASAR
jgi:hypothetical protein